VFLYALALELGIANVEHWKKEISLDQIHRWLAFYRIRPFGDDWRRTARLSMSFAAVMGAKVKADAEEMFLPTHDPHKPQTEEEMIRELMKIPGFKLDRKE
jgi:hypothetical protein